MFNRDIYKDEKAPAFVLLGITLKKYGMAALEYDPELLRNEIENDYSITLPDLNMDKLQSAMVVMTTDHFYEDWRVFETCCHLFNNELIEADVVNPLDAEDIAVGLAEATLIKASTMADISELDFHDEVRAYAGQVFFDYGFATPPTIFKDALMPKVVGSAENDSDKNEALKELFDAHTIYTLNYVEKLN